MIDRLLGKVDLVEHAIENSYKLYDDEFFKLRRRVEQLEAENGILKERLKISNMLSFIRDNTRALSSENSGEVLGRQSVKPFCFTQPSQRQTNSQDDFNDPNSVNEFQVSYEDKHNKPSTALKLRPKIPKPGRKKDQ